MKKVLTCWFGFVWLGGAALAQPPDVLHFRPEAGVAMGQAAGFRVMAAEPLEQKVVTNAPYSAEAVMETTRVLADGTRIVNKNTTSIARDSQGRTRREVKVQTIGALKAADAPTIITIHDPVARETIILNGDDKVATKMKGGSGAMAMAMAKTEAAWSEKARDDKPREGVREERHFNIRVAAPAAGHAEAIADQVFFMNRTAEANSSTESLGKRNIEGLICEGTRISHTIPVGEIGNDRPIVTTIERWYSPELQALVMSETNDPQFGKSTYRLTNISRGEPARYLFQIPADYTVKEGPQMFIRKIEEKKQ